MALLELRKSLQGVHPLLDGTLVRPHEVFVRNSAAGQLGVLPLGRGFLGPGGVSGQGLAVEVLVLRQVVGLHLAPAHLRLGQHHVGLGCHLHSHR